MFRERGREGGREGAKHPCARETETSGLSYAPCRGPGPQRRHVPQQRMEPAWNLQDPPVCGTTPKPLSHTSQGLRGFLMIIQEGPMCCLNNSNIDNNNNWYHYHHHSERDLILGICQCRGQGCLSWVSPPENPAVSRLQRRHRLRRVQCLSQGHTAGGECPSPPEWDMASWMSRVSSKYQLT